MRLALSLALIGSAALAETPRPLVLEQVPLATIDALPTLTTQSPAADLINADINRRNRDVIDRFSSCVRGTFSDFSRSHVVTLAGPRFLSILVSTEGFCSGTAHPFHQLDALVYDLDTGLRFDPQDWLPANLHPGPGPEAYDAAHNLARLKPLTDLYLSLDTAAPDDACHQLLQSSAHDFDFWPDGRIQALVMQPAGLAHVDTPCANPVNIPLDILSRLGFDKALIADLTGK